ncbi:MAG: hypothetical protein PHR84_06255 [Candidatus Omnitrophica bacterium]|jgi:RNA recognition motif-containing protein|nr:hypothetical protein [Candidatus Omnitrophota bacterium]MDD5661350.1 hypothetical protein [Candidatus Omnitrophota bacterium]
MNIFIGNLSFEAKESDVQGFFASFGKVGSVVIVMEKNGKKSRGFGFVEMPDEQEALAAIAALQGREILGRPVNVMPALPKKEKIRPKEHKQENPGSVFPLKRTGKYREGRRTLSFMKRRLAGGITAPVAERKFKANPMRWRKKSKWATPYQKPEGEPKPWKRTEGRANPWIKREGVKSKPWEKTGDKPKLWRKSSSAAGKTRSKTGRGFIKHKR